MSDDIKALLAAFLRDVWNDGNVAAAERYIAPRYTIHHDPGDPWDGQELDLAGYQERVRLSRAPFPDQRFDIVRMLGEGDAIAVTWLWTGTHLGDIPGFPASGRQIKMSGATVYSIGSGRLSGHWQIVDRLGVFQQLRRP